MASGWPPWSTSTRLPSSLSQVKEGSAARPVRKKPSFSLIWAKCTTGGRCPFSSGPKPCEGADWATWTVPSTSPSMPDLPGGAIECRSTRSLRLAGRSDRVLRLEPLGLQEAARHRGDQRRVERGKARELDADLVTQRRLPGCTVDGLARSIGAGRIALPI